MIELSKNISAYITEHFGKDYLDNYREHLQKEQTTFLRLSSLIKSEEKIKNRLSQYGISIERIENIPNAFRVLEGESIVGKTLDFILGAYYIQSLSSMIPALVLKPNETDKVLDLCAAPGSKTTQLAEMMNNRGTLVANEISIERLKSLVFNIDKMNLVNVGVLHGKGELLSKMFSNYFDKILVDAPCSALGIIQKKNEVSNWWNEKKAEGLAEIQFKLLLSAIKACKIGGEIVYSTCTLTLEENELVLGKILKKYPVEIVEIELPVKSREAFTNFGNEKLTSAISKARRIVPWEIGSEGFFVAKLRKIDETENQPVNFTKHKKPVFVEADNNQIKKFLEVLCSYYGVEEKIFNQYKFLIKNFDIYFVNDGWTIENPDPFVRVGSKLGLIDKREFVQLHTLAAQTFGDQFTKNVVELIKLRELDIYLSGGTIKREMESTGQKVVKWNDYIIGTASSSKDGLKSQFPRAYRTQEIILK
ncbi:MAG: RsmB/NOP family class I SAM-dependent RNA methyltransferase [Melioribacteraceae bacterium]|nr:RsmB/NOP family class I SAM-dependent RNA methyltransferase [Melioribacteraceae bacterium]